MKAIRVFIKVTEELDQAIKLNLKQPKIEFEEVEFYFPIHSVGEAYITKDGFINTVIHGREVFLKKDKKVWEKIRTYLE